MQGGNLQALVEEQITERWLRVFKNMECHSTINDTKYRGQVSCHVHPASGDVFTSGMRLNTRQFLDKKSLFAPI